MPPLGSWNLRKYLRCFIFGVLYCLVNSVLWIASSLPNEDTNITSWTSMVPHVYETFENFQPSRHSVMSIFLQGVAKPTSIYDTEDMIFEQFGELFEPCSVINTPMSEC